MRMLLLTLCLSLSLNVWAFEITTVPEEIPESNPVTRTRVTDGKTLVSFIAPAGWTPSTDARTKRISLQSPPPRATINIQISTNAMPANLAQLKQQVATRFEDATIVEEFQAPSGGAAGLGVDVRHVVNGRLTILTRLCVYKTPDGAVEVSLAASPNDMEAVHWMWTGFINSFRVEPRPAAPAAQK